MLSKLLKFLAVSFIIMILITAWGVDKEIEDNGGIKQTIIKIGKDIRDIGREIGSN